MENNVQIASDIILEMSKQLGELAEGLFAMVPDGYGARYADSHAALLGAQQELEYLASIERLRGDSMQEKES